MSKNELKEIWGNEVALPYREKIEKLQQVLVDYCKDNNLDIDIAKENRKTVYPSYATYNHYFSKGLYIREAFFKKNYLGFTVIHNTANPLFLMKGKISFSSKEGIQELTAPTHILAKSGSKKIVLVIEDCIVVNVHPNPSGTTDLKQIEDEIYSTTFEEYDNLEIEDMWKMVKQKDIEKIEYEKNK
jgi:hypothetical protein